MKTRLPPWFFLLLISAGIFFLNNSSAFPQSEDSEEDVFFEEAMSLEKPQSLSGPAPVEYRKESTALSSSSGATTGARQSKISLDLKGLDIIDVLKMLSARSSMNIVVGKNVTGKVTIFLKDVNIWDAFEIILASNNLAYETKDNIIYVMTDRDYEFIYGEKFGDKKQLLTRSLQYAKAQDVSATLNQIKSNVGRVIIDEATNTVVALDTPVKVQRMELVIDNLDKPTETKVFELKYAQADKISPKIQEAISKGVGSIRLDERTNKIAVTDFPDKVAQIGKIITAFDEKTPQVRIDAQIVEISPDKDEFKMGVDWDVWINKNFRFINSLSLGNANKLSLGMAAGGINVSEKYDRKGTIDALRTIGKTKILSSPSIMALNNQEAKILVGTKEAYITSTVSQGGTGTEVTSQQVNFIDVGIKLYVTPTINKDGFVTMKIKPEVSSSKTTNLTSEGKITQVPIVTTSEAETAISIKDGATIVIAGLKRDKKEDEIIKFPVLGDIPLLGVLFRSVTHTVNKTELVIFLTPHIVTDENLPLYTSLTHDEDILKLNQQSEKARPLTLEENREPFFTNIQDYGEHLRKKIMSAVSVINDYGPLKGEALVSFMLFSDGQLNGEPRIIFLTSEKLREPAMNAIKAASPFAKFPPDLAKPQEKFSLSIVYD